MKVFDPRAHTRQSAIQSDLEKSGLNATIAKRRILLGSISLLHRRFSGARKRST